MADYGEDNVIAVGLYGGALGYLPNGKPMPLTCDESQWYYTTGGVDQSPQPIARIDRGDFNFKLGEASKVPEDSLWYVKHGWTINEYYNRQQR